MSTAIMVKMVLMMLEEEEETMKVIECYYSLSRSPEMI
jgi:hypothetical protein